MQRLVIALSAIVLFLSSTIAEASPKTTAAIAAYKKLQRDQRLFKRRVAGLSIGEKVEVKSIIENSASSDDVGADPDSDGLDNETEEALGTNSCSSDSDGDGSNDGDDSDEDGGDGAYAKGSVVSIVSRVITVGTTAFMITDDTVFRGRGFSEEGLEAGQCVEIEGHVSAWTNVADKIKLERSGECGGGEDD